MSGLYLNYSKSSFITWNAGDHGWTNDLATSFGCRQQKCPFTYLGLPLGENMSKASAWKPVIDKVKHRLASWKAKTISRAGRLTLIRSVLNCLPVYFMSMFKLPKSVASQIIKLQRRFFWGELCNENLSLPFMRRLGTTV